MGESLYEPKWSGRVCGGAPIFLGQDPDRFFNFDHSFEVLRIFSTLWTLSSIL